MSTALMFSSRKWRRMAMALQPQQLSSSMVTPGAKRGRVGHRQHLGRGARASGPATTEEPSAPLALPGTRTGQPRTSSQSATGQFPALVSRGLGAARGPGGPSLPLGVLSPLGQGRPLSWAVPPALAASSAPRSALGSSPVGLLSLLQGLIPSGQ